MRESVAETLIGIAVVAVGSVFLWYALATGGDGGGSDGRYNVTARFNNVSGIARGTDVRLAGVKVGVVQDIEPDFELYDAVVTIALNSDLDNLPDDTDARISQDGLLGGSYIALEPGAGFDTIPTDGSGEIIYTRGSVDLLTLVSSVAGGDGGGQ